jgi:hypothetical protein
MQRIDDRTAVVNLARAIVGRGSRTSKQQGILELLFLMSQKDDVSKRGERSAVRARRSVAVKTA